jgi:hypothetical protein
MLPTRFFFVIAMLGCNRGSDVQPPAGSPVAPTAPIPAPQQPPQPALTGTFAECASDCRFDFRELEASAPRVTQRYCRDATPSCIAFDGQLTPAGRVQLKGLGRKLAQANLEPAYGCGSCVDGNDYKFVLRHDDGSVTEHSYDASRSQDGAIPEIRAAHPLFDGISRALSTCVSNELVQIGAECTPRDALSPRPYSRP